MIFPATLKGSYIEQMTDEEFFAFCQDNRDFKFERTPEGQLILISPTHYLTGKRNNEILFQLTQWNKKFKKGECVDSDTGFYLPNNAMRNPDAAWISHERLKTIKPDELQSFLHLCPDFIIELKSKQTLLIAHNIDLAPRVDGLSLNDQIEFFGEYEWNDKGGVIHWTHDDPEEIHVNGWIFHNNVIYQ